MLYPTWEVPESVEFDMLEDQGDGVIALGDTPLIDTKSMKLHVNPLGRPILVSELEAFAQWIYNALKTERGKYLAYSSSFGIELSDLTEEMDRDVIASEVKRRAKELILRDNRAISIREEATEVQGDELFVSFIIETIYGELSMNRIRIGGD
ncbi:DUF2634 domain-containing protein [Geomicrobium sediminis]|uniref:DUF2634 domain-containing protein n=1 Tax=Geomicrobium sediminis TaxID=1347788 RepID=A0ABS2PG73_9BACL|nr:DUF2634 domain-containing protein [Geomicrobium sediminis]MBM7633823.1 hypothetical protein [Geomicrobium sediminis]